MSTKRKPKQTNYMTTLSLLPSVHVFRIQEARRITQSRGEKAVKTLAVSDVHIRCNSFSLWVVNLFILNFGLIESFKTLFLARFWECERHWHSCSTAFPHYSGWLTSGMSGPVTCRIPPAPQLSGRSCWNRNPEETPHLGSFPSLACRPTLEGPAVLHTEPMTCASYHLADTKER